MDITTVTSFRPARTRADLALAPGEVPIAGGTWLMSEPQPGTTGFVDLTAMGWPDLEITAEGLRLGATCTIATLVAWAQGKAHRRTHGGVTVPPAPPSWRALEIVVPAANALLASFKIWNTATVGGNVCRSFAAGAMVSLAVALDGVAVVWSPDLSERRVPVADLVTGNGTNALGPGEILRAVELPTAALTARASLHKIALAELGRSGAVVTGRLDTGGGVVIGVTAATSRPLVLRYPGLPTADVLRADVEASPWYYSDPLGPADWRRSVAGTLAVRALADLHGLSGESDGSTG